ncbi:MAG: ribosomal protein L10e/L16, partial [Olpidium bornovanus]
MLRNAYRAATRASPAGGNMRTAAGAVTAAPAGVSTVRRPGVVSAQRRPLHASACAQASSKGGAAATRQNAKKNHSWFVTRSLIPSLYSLDGKQAYIEWPLPQLPLRRQMKGRIPISLGGSLKGTRLRFAPYGIAADTGVIYTQFQLDAAKEKAKRVLRGNRQAHIFMRVFANVPRTKKSMGARMGKGKGAIDHFVVRVSKSHM